MQDRSTQHRILSRAIAAPLTVLLVSALVATAPGAVAADPPPGPPPAVLTPGEVQRSTAPIPTEPGVRRAIGGLTRSGSWGRFSGVVVDPGSGRVLFDRRADRALVPASTAKLATAAAALETFGPAHRLTTTVSQADDTVYLTGGGDTTLTRPQLKKLARAASTALRTSDSVRVVYDTDLFTGPELGPDWSRSFPAAGVAAPVSALMVGLGRTSPGARSRVSDPARQAARFFADALRATGVKVRSVRSGATPSTARVIARHQSAPMTELVGDLLTDSDNDLAESLAHLVGGEVVGDASFAGGARATTAILKDAGIDVAGMRLADGSGLSRQNAISADTLADLLSEVVLGTQPAWWPITSGLAVAGRTGTLEDRFGSKATKAGAGVVRAKTGSLTGVSALAGLVRDDDGRLLVFALISNKVSSLSGARETMDRIASRLAECGCTS